MVNNPKLRVYTLSNYSEELIAVAFAKTSRSPEPFDQIAKELDEAKSSQFHEKWVVGYGHSSVAEHAILHLAVENASRLAIDVLESTRLSSYTEKSTRYQIITKDLAYTPEFDEESKKEYLETIEVLFDAYNKSIEKLTEYYNKTEPEDKENPKKREMEVKLKAIDHARFLLPLSTYANVGITINARSLEHMLAKMFSNNLPEVKLIAEEIKEKAKKETPTLIKYANKSEYLSSIYEKLEKEFYNFEKEEGNAGVKLVEYDEDAEEKLITSIIYKTTGVSYSKAKEKAKNMSKEEKEKIVDIAIGEKGKFDRPIRELEYINYTFDTVMDFGAYYDFKRHRMCTMSMQKIGVDLGYYMPEDFEKAGLKEIFENAMKKSSETYNKLKIKYPYEASYICTNAHKRRTLAQMNLRELYHFIKLRASPMAHFTIRPIAEGMLEELKRVHPLLVKYLKAREY
ncbi:MAG: FAD-dependent thymidylate synthase [Candidatus ainarchaeum sp.]|nr:FAD-dependent thymidylate synthase [Candidatus ainarchaeum sp.]